MTSGFRGSLCPGQPDPMRARQLKARPSGEGEVLRIWNVSRERACSPIIRQPSRLRRDL